MKARSCLKPQAIQPACFPPAEPGPAFPPAATAGQQSACVKSAHRELCSVLASSQEGRGGRGRAFLKLGYLLVPDSPGRKNQDSWGFLR